MTSLKRRVLNGVTQPFGVNVVRRGSAWKWFEAEHLDRFLRAFAIDCVFDVGANVGQYGTMLRDIGFAGLIISFEPNPAAFAALREASSKDKLWIAENIALDETRKTATFNVMANSEFSSLHEPDHSATAQFHALNTVSQRISVETEMLDNLFGSLKERYGFSRPFLKMDTQGHDLKIIRGAEGVLRNFIGLQSELSFTQIYADQPSAFEALGHYASKNFQLTALIQNNHGYFPNLNEMDCIMYNRAFFSDSLSSYGWE
jgi:FkbM family methyltransferase